ncbi:MAG: hypothetical protein JO262_22380 [Solirubrobacterales bacterium]|nr:hypothetical protein [Solirubrobacterales bacterium]
MTGVSGQSKASPAAAAVWRALASGLRVQALWMRHRVPNLVAVGFHHHGDVPGVARTLNGETG